MRVAKNSRSSLKGAVPNSSAIKSILPAGLAVSLFFTACVNNGARPGVYITSSTGSPEGLVTHIRTADGDAVVSSPQGRVGNMKGIALRHSLLLGLISWGSTGVGEAARKAAPEFRFRNSPHEGIREVDTVAKGGVKILWGILYCNEQTIVTGDSAPVRHGCPPRHRKHAHKEVTGPSYSK